MSHGTSDCPPNGQESGYFSRPTGGPRGILRFYILYRIAEKPAHGYELIQDISDRTDGAWSPGAGSIYPILKKLVSEGLIKSGTPDALDDRHVYQITPRGLKVLQEIKGIFAHVGERWGAMRGLFMDMVEPDKVQALLLEGSKKQFEFMRDFVKSKMSTFPTEEIEYMLKEYVLDLERQLSWTNQTLAGLKKPVTVSKKPRN